MPTKRSNCCKASASSDEPCPHMNMTSQCRVARISRSIMSLKSSPTKASVKDRRQPSIGQKAKWRLRKFLKKIFRIKRSDRSTIVLAKEENILDLEPDSIRNGCYDPDAIVRSLPVNTPGGSELSKSRNLERSDIKTYDWSSPQ
jgi:hypothetical protein